MENVFQKVTAFFQSIDQAVPAANRLDKAYADGVGHPEYHTPFDATSNPQMVAMNLAGIYAADTFGNMMSLYYGEEADEDAYVQALQDLEAGAITEDVKSIAKNLANLEWRAGQPFRDMAAKPLNRITREVNMQFSLLPSDEEDKDLIQVREGARVLLEHISKS